MHTFLQLCGSHLACAHALRPVSSRRTPGFQTRVAHRCRYAVKSAPSLACRRSSSAWCAGRTVASVASRSAARAASSRRTARRACAALCRKPCMGQAKACWSTCFCLPPTRRVLPPHSHLVRPRLRRPANESLQGGGRFGRTRDVRCAGVTLPSTCSLARNVTLGWCKYLSHKQPGELTPGLLHYAAALGAHALLPSELVFRHRTSPAGLARNLAAPMRQELCATYIHRANLKLVHVLTCTHRSCGASASSATLAASAAASAAAAPSASWCSTASGVRLSALPPFFSLSISGLNPDP